MKKATSFLLALMMALSIIPAAFATAPAKSGPPEIDISTVITPKSLTVYQGEPMDFTALTTYNAAEGDSQGLLFLSDSWAGTDTSIPAEASELAISGESTASTSRRVQSFLAKASVSLPNEPGEYTLRVIYTVTLQYDFAGVMTYIIVKTSACFPVEVLKGTADAAVLTQAEAALAAKTPAVEGQLVSGQIVSAWAHWKTDKTAGYTSGAAGVYRTLNWYKTQVENGIFMSEQEVYDYLDSIYNPENLQVIVEAAPEAAPEAPKDNPSDDQANPASEPVKP